MQPGGRIGGHAVGELLGAGGIARVYRGVGPDGADVALKVLAVDDADLARRFLAEGRIQARLRHPNIVAVHATLDTPDGVVLVQELVDGPDLRSVLAAGPLPVDEAERVFRGVLSGLAYAHAHGVVHRDLKPSNVLLDGPDRVPRLVDFGIARIQIGAGSLVDPEHPQTVVFLGTPGYAAPEQIWRPEAIDHRVDIFAAGALLYELVCGVPAFPVANGDVLVAVAQGRWAPLPVALPPHIERLIHATLAADPAARPPDIDAVIALLDAGEADQTFDADASIDRDGEHSRSKTFTLHPDARSAHGSQRTERPGAAPLVDRYVLGEPLGEGGMGVVWRAYDRVLRRDVALKVVRPDRVRSDALARFTQEAQVTGQLGHPNIVPVHDLGTLPDGSLFFTMKVVRGRSFQRVLTETWADVDRGVLPYRDAVVEMIRVLERVAEALAFAHDAGVVHRDIKPDNVMVGAFGEVQVMDWGLARLLEVEDPPLSITSDRGESADHTRAGLVAGTPAFMAPEQARGEIERIGPHTDVWALGAMLYVAVVGAPAFLGSAREILATVASGPQVVPTARARQAVPRELDAIVRRAMEPAIGDRYPQMRGVLDDLRAWQDGRPLSGLRYSAPELALKWVQRNRLAVRAAAVTGLVALVALAVGGARYVRDLDVARQVAEAHAADARLQLAHARLATGEALIEDLRVDEARDLLVAARAGLRDAGQATLPADLALWRAHRRSQMPFAHLPGQLVALQEGGAGMYMRRGDRILLLSLPEAQSLGSWPAPPGQAIDVRGDPAVVTSLEGATVWRGELGSPPTALFELPPGFDWVQVRGEAIVACELQGGSVIATEGDDGWAVRPLHSERYVQAAAGARRGGLAVLISMLDRTELWDLDAGQLLRVVEQEHAYAVLDPGGSTLFGLFEGRTELRAEDVATGVVRWTLPTRMERPRLVSPDGRWLVLTASDGTGTVRDASTGALAGRLDGNIATQWPAEALAATDALIVAGSVEGEVLLWTWPDPGLEEPIDEPVGAVALAAGPGAEGWLLAGGVPGELVLWELPGGAKRARWSIEADARRVVYSDDGATIGVAMPGAEHAVLAPVSGGDARRVRVGEGATALRVAGDALYVGYRDGAVARFDGERERWRHETGRETVWDLRVHDGVVVVSAHKPGRVEALDAGTGALRWGVDAPS